jgi:hypothetical protein
VPVSGWHAIRLDGAPVPVSPAAGPFTRGQHLASRFTDTPAGAVLAAVGIAVRTSGQLGPAIFIPTIARQVTGTGSAALLAAARADYAQAATAHQPGRPGGPAGKATAAARGFRLTSWTPAAATVQVITIADGADGRGVVTGLQVRWQRGDWRLVAPPGGNFAAAASPAASLSGFTALPGR